jgi:hypothetical protein
MESEIVVETVAKGIVLTRFNINFITNKQI